MRLLIVNILHIIIVKVFYPIFFPILKFQTYRYVILYFSIFKKKKLDKFSAHLWIYSFSFIFFSNTGSYVRVSRYRRLSICFIGGNTMDSISQREHEMLLLARTLIPRSGNTISSGIPVRLNSKLSISIVIQFSNVAPKRGNFPSYFSRFLPFEL